MNRATPALLVCSRSAGNNVQKLAGMAPVSLSLDAVLNYDTFLFDADGVLWTGDHPVPGAIQFISTLLATGKRVFVITNNSTKTLDMYMTKLAKVGFGNVPKENVISPAMVLADFIRTAPGYKGKEIYLIGTENLRKTLEDAGVHCFGTGPDHMTEYGEQDIMHDIQLHGNPKAVVCSYDSHFSYPKLMKAANYLSRKDVDFLVTNEDYTFPGPIPGVVIPGSGATSACVRAVSGREPLVFGKPGRPLADFLKKNHRIKPETTIMFGDRLDTDIAFANVNRFASCLVLTGVHNLDDAAKAQEDGKTDLVPKFTFSFA